jgi:Mg-chelatase subunit ChlD
MALKAPARQTLQAPLAMKASAAQETTSASNQEAYRKVRIQQAGNLRKWPSSRNSPLRNSRRSSNPGKVVLVNDTSTSTRGRRRISTTVMPIILRSMMTMK